MTRIRMVALAVAGFISFGAAARAQTTAAAPVNPRIAEMLKQLKDPDWDTRMEAATALGRLGPAAKPAIPNLLDALGDPEPAVRMKAIDAFMFMGRDAAETAPRIIPMLKDPNELVRVSAVIALPRVSADPASTVPLLKTALSDPAWVVRRRAAIELVHLGAESEATLPVLREGLRDPVPSYRMEAIGNLVKVAPPAERQTIVDLVLRYLKDPDDETRIEAIRTLSGMGAEAVPPLIGVLTAPNEPRHVQAAAIRALGRIGPPAKDALPHLRPLLKLRGILLKTTEKAIASIEGNGPRMPEEKVGPVPSLSPLPVASPAPPR